MFMKEKAQPTCVDTMHHGNFKMSQDYMSIIKGRKNKKLHVMMIS